MAPEYNGSGNGSGSGYGNGSWSGSGSTYSTVGGPAVEGIDWSW